MASCIALGKQFARFAPALLLIIVIPFLWIESYHKLQRFMLSNGISSVLLSNPSEGGQILKLEEEPISNSEKLISNVEQSIPSSRIQVPETATVVPFHFPNISEPCIGTVTVKRGGGRFGNQLFKYAALFGVALRNNLKPYYPPNYEFHAKMKEAFCNFAIPDGSCNFSDSNMIEDIGQSGASHYNKKVENLDPEKNYKLGGYLISWKYFDSFKEPLAKSLEMCPEFENFADDYFEKSRELLGLKNSSVENVVIHVRRGDFLWADKQRFGYLPSNADFIKLAIDYVSKRIQPGEVPIFYMVSNSIEWCKDNFKNLERKIIFVDFNQDFKRDFSLLKHADVVILSAGISTFGWWGAYLNDRAKFVVYNFPYSRISSSADKDQPPEHYMYPAWVPLYFEDKSPLPTPKN